MIIDVNKVELFYIVNYYFIFTNINSLPAFFFFMILIILVILAPKPIEAITGNCPDGGNKKLTPVPSPIIKRLAMFKLADCLRYRPA